MVIASTSSATGRKGRSPRQRSSAKWHSATTELAPLPTFTGVGTSV